MLHPVDVVEEALPRQHRALHEVVDLDQGSGLRCEALGLLARRQYVYPFNVLSKAGY